jgi:hypothetical protein
MSDTQLSLDEYVAAMRRVLAHHGEVTLGHDLPKDNRDSDICLWCGQDTEKRMLLTSTYYYCKQCGR